MKIAFYKMHGAGNDFILVDDRTVTFPTGDAPWIRRLCDRRTGVGSDGLMLIQPSRSADFRMRFFNPDGGEAEMCGNGARCIARLAHELGVAPARMTIETAAGPVQAEALGERVRLRMTDPRDWRLGRQLEVDGRRWTYDFVNTGVPHAVIRVEQLADLDVQRDGAAFRYHSDFAPAGTNADFIEITGPSRLNIRTYERGVESETLACGTGIVAAALVAARNGWASPPIRVVTRGGFDLSVEFHWCSDTAEDVILDGPAAHVFQGVLDYPG